MPLYFTQTALAEFLGVNRSALSRELGRMQDENLIEVNDKKMKLLL
ncbi:helix-turn-helix domain-containing protein [Mediterraneibacter gnavus]|nr:helix-turn-helix domain-containing protein [Mediterraneibacter gnavus]